MQDRFKFRAWHKKRKKMYDVLHFHTATWDNGGEWVTAKGFNIITQQYIHIQIEPKDSFIMQCTGLKDKNGREIYDGDILKFKLLEDFAAFGTNEKYVEIIAPVIYEYGGFFIEQSENSIFLGQLPMSEIEVVGNIYENPELLEVTNKIKENKEWK